MGQVISSISRCLGFEKAKKDGVDNRSLISHAQGLSYCFNIYPNNESELHRSFSPRIVFGSTVSHPLLRDHVMVASNEKHLIDVPCSESCMDHDHIDRDYWYPSVVDDSSMLCSDQGTERVNYVEEIKDVITSENAPTGPAKQVFKSEAEDMTKVEFVNGSNVEGAISKEITVEERRIWPYTSPAPGRCWVVKGTSPLANTVTTSGKSQEEIEDVIMNEDEPRRRAKQVFAGEAETTTKVAFVNGSSLEGVTSLAPGRSCWVVKGTSPPLLATQESFSSAANMVTASCNSKGNATKHGNIGPYTCTQRILLVGEGDFSFSACLAIAFGSASNMVATSLNSLDFLIKNYGNFPANLSELETRGSVVLHGVDATKMANHRHLSMMKFDRIIFNFPHSGFKQDSPESQIRRHQKLVRGFLKNAKKMIEDNGEIHVTHKANPFFLKWDIQKLGSDQGLYLIQELKFKRSKYPGYHTKYGFGGDKDFDCNPSKTYKFGLTS